MIGSFLHLLQQLNLFGLGIHLARRYCALGLEHEHNFLSTEWATELFFYTDKSKVAFKGGHWWMCTTYKLYVCVLVPNVSLFHGHEWVPDCTTTKLKATKQKMQCFICMKLRIMTQHKIYRDKRIMIQKMPIIGETTLLYKVNLIHLISAFVNCTCKTKCYSIIYTQLT